MSGEEATPGPWTFRAADGEIIAKDGSHVAHVRLSTDRPEEHAANGALLAAAGMSATEERTERTKEREAFLLGVIAHLDDMDCWYLDQHPEWRERLRADFRYDHDHSEEANL